MYTYIVWPMRPEKHVKCGVMFSKMTPLRHNNYEAMGHNMRNELLAIIVLQGIAMMELHHQGNSSSFGMATLDLNCN